MHRRAFANVSRCLAVLAMFIAKPPCAWATTLRVPGQFPTIQEAVNAASDGDRIEVLGGTYLENIDLLGKAIHVIGVDGASQTFVNGMTTGRCITMASGEGVDTIVEALTLTNGTETIGGGLLCDGSSPTLVDLVIVDNIAQVGGGAAIVGGSAAPRLEGVVFDGNESSLEGGCLFIGATTGTIVIASTLVRFGFCGARGGGIYVGNATLDFHDGWIVNNVASSSGGGVALDNGASASFVNTDFTLNAADFGGGAIDQFGGALDIGESKIAVNSSDGDGAGIRVRGSAILAMHETVLTGNAALASGGALCVTGAGCDVDITRCTLITNTAGTGAGGAQIDAGTVAIENSILWDNLPAAVAGNGSIAYSDVQGGVAGPGNLDQDPAFEPGLPFLTATSPCIDAGNPASPPDPDGTDADMGAFYFPQVIIEFVRGDCNGDQSGDVSDAIFLLSHLFAMGPGSSCNDACDLNDDGTLDIGDPVALLANLFVPGSPPVPDPSSDCGDDPTADGLDCGGSPSCP